MTTNQTILEGLWLPLITPFLNGELDETSLRRLVRHFSAESIDGLIVSATTGEGLTLSDTEIERLVTITADELAALPDKLPLFLGLSGSDTRKIVETLGDTNTWPIDGYLISCPYYTRPSQEGLVQHFETLAANTDRSISIYNIPYRTGVNLENEAMLRLANLPNIVGVKDCSAIPAQSFDLIGRRPDTFSVLTGEDAFYFTALVNGANGGILASAHIQTQAFADVLYQLSENDHSAALATWNSITGLAQLLFAEPSPSPIKYWLWRVGLIDSPEVRLPMQPVSDHLAQRIDDEISQATKLKCA
jgi:4-hydroxy-tetrahydrodipicolinate synthase